RFFLLEAKNLADKGLLYKGNEVHGPAALEYLLGLTTHKQAEEKDSMYRTALDLPPEEVFKIRQRLASGLGIEVGKDIREGLQEITTAYNPPKYLDQSRLGRFFTAEDGNPKPVKEAITGLEQHFSASDVPLKNWLGA